MIKVYFMNCRQQNAVFNFENIFLVLQYIQLPYEHTSNYAVIAYLLYFNVIIINEQFLLEKHKVDTEIKKINVHSWKETIFQNYGKKDQCIYM